MGYNSIRIKVEGLLKILIQSKKTRISAKKTSDTLLILGNGPSLKNDYSTIKELAKNADVLGVNYFVATNEFFELKPQHHVIISSLYWRSDENKDWENDRKKLFQILVEKVNWKLNLFVPMIAKSDTTWNEFIRQNKNISVQFINITPLDDFPLFFRKKLKAFKACPRPHNVLVPSVLVGINLGYSKCLLFGADHSWIPELTVGKDNIVYVVQKHFYADQLKHTNSTLLADSKKPVFYDNTTTPQKLHEILQKYFYSFKSYWFLKEYAEAEGTKIYNLTEGSFIDAFEKKSYDEITT